MLGTDLNKQLAHIFQPLFISQFNIKFQMDLINLKDLKIAKKFGMQILERMLQLRTKISSAKVGINIVSLYHSMWYFRNYFIVFAICEL